MLSEVKFVQEVTPKRIPLSEAVRGGFEADLRIIAYWNAAHIWGRELDIKDAPYEPLSYSDHDSKLLIYKLCELESLMDELKARNVEHFDSNYARNSVVLNGDWRTWATSLVRLMREVVRDAEFKDEKLRENIYAALDNLQSEIDRNRTRLAAAADAWDQLCDATGKGAKKLEPAVKILERLRKGLGKAEAAQIEAQEQPRLPPPPDEEDE